MPILPHQPDINPPDLLAETERALELAHSWWALHTLPHQEKRLMDRLLQAGIAFYCPLVKQTRPTPAGRRLVSWLSLFPGYVFLHGPDEHRYEALQTKRVLRALSVVDAEQLVHDLRQIQRLIASGLPIGREPRIPPGTQVRVRAGPLAGLEGVVIKHRGRHQLLVAVNFLQQGASVAIEESMVEWRTRATAVNTTT